MSLSVSFHIVRGHFGFLFDIYHPYIYMAKYNRDSKRSNIVIIVVIYQFVNIIFRQCLLTPADSLYNLKLLSFNISLISFHVVHLLLLRISSARLFFFSSFRHLFIFLSLCLNMRNRRFFYSTFAFLYFHTFSLQHNLPPYLLLLYENFQKEERKDFVLNMFHA